ncbi:hypothetical protein V2W45_204406 [Cenococcum geophilum]
MARKKEKSSDEHITFKEKENERICRIIQCDFSGITDNVPDNTQSSAREQTRKKILKNTPFWTVVIVLLLSLIGTTVAIVLLVLDEGQHAGYQIGTAFAISATVLASIFLWHMWNDRRKHRRLFKQQTELELAELRLHYQHSRPNYPGTSLSDTKYSSCPNGSTTPTVGPKRRSKVVGEGFEMQDMRRALRGSHRPKFPYPQRSDSQPRQDIIVANYISDGKPLPPTPRTPEEEWDQYRHQQRQYHQNQKQLQQAPVFPARPIQHPKPHPSRIPVPKYTRQLSNQTTFTTSALRTSSSADNFRTTDGTAGLTMMPPRIDSQFWRALNGYGAQQEVESPPPVPPKDDGTPTRSPALPKSMSAPSMSSPPFHVAQQQLLTNSGNTDRTKSITTLPLPPINSPNPPPIRKIPRKPISHIHVSMPPRTIDGVADVSASAPASSKLARRLTLRRSLSIIPITFKTTTVAAVRGGDDVGKNTEKIIDELDVTNAHGNLDCAEIRNKDVCENEFQEVDLNDENGPSLGTLETVVRLNLRVSAGSGISMRSSTCADSVAEECITEAGEEEDVTREELFRDLEVYEGT